MTPLPGSTDFLVSGSFEGQSILARMRSDASIVWVRALDSGDRDSSEITELLPQSDGSILAAGSTYARWFMMLSKIYPSGAGECYSEVPSFALSDVTLTSKSLGDLADDPERALVQGSSDENPPLEVPITPPINVEAQRLCEPN